MTRIGSLFSGYGGLEQGVQSVLGGTVAWHSEIDPGACKILAHRYPDVPNLGDITAVDWAAAEPVDVLTGGFPCQDVSAAGKRAGIRPDTRSGLWTQFAYAIDQLRPSLVVIENVRGLLSASAHSDLEPCPWCVGDDERVLLRALGAVLGDLADIGYDASWQGLRAADVGAPHGRFRVFVTAWPAADAGVLGRNGRSGVIRGGRDKAVGGAPADTHGDALRQQPVRELRSGGAPIAGHAGADAAAHPEGHGRHEGRPEPARIVGGSDASLSGDDAAADAHRDGLEGFGGLVALGRDADGCGSADVAWGNYGPAVHRWERRIGRPAPSPTEPGSKGQPRLSPAFVEWMMGLPAGWVTQVPGIGRNEQLKALGNGVVPQQAAEALRILLPDVATPPAYETEGVA